MFSSPGPDPRFAMLSPIVQSEVLTTPQGLTRSISRSRAAALLDPSDAMSFTTITDTTTVNGLSFLEVFAKAPRTITRTTPLGRQVVTTLDAKVRVGQIAVPGVLPVQLAYDAHGRLETVTQGTRTLTRAYGPDGFLDSITDPLMQLHLFDMDAVGRMLSETRPDDNEQVLCGHDAAGEPDGGDAARAACAADGRARPRPVDGACTRKPRCRMINFSGFRERDHSVR
ncbi:MAG: hypothetical protein IT372_25720 [Polyangiaceae bacterium]|nr:hypothetical protein [Polyangiaceae bacterium]